MYLSIEIGNKSIKIVSGKKNNNRIIIYNRYLIKTPKGAFENGQIVNIDELKTAINKTIKRKNLPTNKVVFNISTQSLITRDLSLPILKSKIETLDMIKYELGQYMPIIVDEYSLLYKIIHTYEEEGSLKGKYNIYAIPNKLYNDYLKLAEELKFNLISFDLLFINLNKIIKPNVFINNHKITEDDAIVMINIGHETIVFNIVINEVIEFSRIIEVGGKDIDIDFENQFDIDSDSASKLKHSLTNIYDESSEDQIQTKKIVKKNIDRWVDEILRLIQYFTSRNKDVIIDKAYIYGGSSNIIGIESYLSEQLDINVELLKNISTIKAHKKFKSKNFDIKIYLNAITGLFYNRKDTNFISAKISKRKKDFSKFAILLFIILSVIMSIFLYYYQYLTRVKEYEKAIEIIESKLTAETNLNTLEEINELENKLEILDQYKDIINFINVHIDKTDFIKTKVLEDISSTVPNNATVDYMVIDSTTIQIQGMAESRESIAQFQRNLRNIDYVDKVYVPALNEMITDNYKYSFSITCNIKDVN